MKHYILNAKAASNLSLFVIKKLIILMIYYKLTQKTREIIKFTKNFNPQ